MSGVRPLDALNSQVAFIRALRGPEGSLYAATGFHGNIIPNDAGHAARYLAEKIDTATTIVVTDRMLDVVLDRMRAIKYGEPLTRDDLMFDAGYVVFPRPVMLPDLTGDDYAEVWPRRHTMGFDAGFWLPSVTYSTDFRPVHGDTEAPGIMYAQALSPRLARQLTPAGVDVTDYEASIERIERSGVRHVPVYSSGWAFGLSWDPAEREESFVLTPAGEFERRFWLSLWRALKDEILAPVRFRRQDRRPAERLGLIPDVVVHDLRRVKHPVKEERLPTGETIMWSHRWKVRGHVRTLHRGTDKERAVWVREHVKGPENRPLIEKDTVYRLSR